MAGEDNDGQFTGFTQVGACNAAAFFAAANDAITAGKLHGARRRATRSTARPA